MRTINGGFRTVMVGHNTVSCVDGDVINCGCWIKGVKRREGNVNTGKDV